MPLTALTALQSLERLPGILDGRKIEAFVDTVFALDDVNAAMAKVAAHEQGTCLVFTPAL